MLTGKNGQVGWELNRSLLPLGEIIALDRTQCDLSKPETLPALVQEIKPDVIVNAAAYTAVDKAESEEELVTSVNGVSPGVLAEEANKIGALLVHYSTDYVFDGTKETPYTEEDMPNPINAYGRSKLKGEQAIHSVNTDYLIFRTSGVYAARGNNFLCTIIRLAQEKEELRVVADQVGAPTWARLIAETTSICLFKTINERYIGASNSGIYHLTSSGVTSWYDFAKYIVDRSRKFSINKLKSIKPITTDEYPTTANRPVNSKLRTDKLENIFNVVMPSWEQSLDLCIDGMK
jgi:dTDP-4-dehydrorhamnose reductase